MKKAEDFIPGQPFAAGLLGRNDALWLQCPVRIEMESGEPKAVAVKDSVACTNRRYLRGVVQIPAKREVAQDCEYLLLLLDTDCDGDYGDSGGALGVWAVQQPAEEALQLVALQPMDGSGVFGGYRWRLARRLSGEMVLNGERVSREDIKILRVGDQIPALEVEAIDGRRTKLAAPEGGCLLLYVWSTWYSACQRDIPTGFIELYPRFKDRGLHMVGISTDYRKEDLAAFAAEHDMAFPQVFDGPDMLEGVTATLGLTESPTAVLVDDSGRVLSIGQSVDSLWSYLDRRLAE